MKFFIVDNGSRYLKNLISWVSKHPKKDTSTDSEQIFCKLVSVLAPTKLLREQYV